MFRLATIPLVGVRNPLRRGGHRAATLFLVAVAAALAPTAAAQSRPANVVATVGMIGDVAFEYFGRAHGFDVVGIQGVSTVSEAPVADIRATAKTIASAGVPAVFVETTIDPRTVEAVLAAAEGMGSAAELSGSLYADAMGEPGTPDGTYLGMLRTNTVAIVAALGGEVPPLPPELAPWARRAGLETTP